MEKGLSEIKHRKLPPGFISDFLFYFKRSNRNGNSIPGEKISLAIAFTKLYLSDPHYVTDYHKKILKKEFSNAEIEELIELINRELMD
ncbi:MAG: hypothetical protein KFF73_04335 [Cyclobacteriaceae bacterium]|nr:hypothetical protein [Cyclobacteriaceae bacterium]